MYIYIYMYREREIQICTLWITGPIFLDPKVQKIDPPKPNTSKCVDFAV